MIFRYVCLIQLSRLPESSKRFVKHVCLLLCTEVPWLSLDLAVCVVCSCVSDGYDFLHNTNILNIVFSRVLHVQLTV